LKHLKLGFDGKRHLLNEWGWQLATFSHVTFLGFCAVRFKILLVFVNYFTSSLSGRTAVAQAKIQATLAYRYSGDFEINTTNTKRQKFSSLVLLEKTSRHENGF